MDHAARKPVCGVFDQVMHKQVYSASETSYNSDILHVEKVRYCSYPVGEQIAKTLTRVFEYAGWVVPLLFACNKVSRHVTMYTTYKGI